MCIHAYAKLAGMKLFAYRALDYLHAAGPDDRRYLLFNAVQKAKVGTEGVRVMDQLAECIGARGFESDTYFEMAQRDARLVPGLEGSTHINFEAAARFVDAYLLHPEKGVSAPAPAHQSANGLEENAHLLGRRSDAVRGVRFAECLSAYRPLRNIANVRLFVGQIRAFRGSFLTGLLDANPKSQPALTILLGRCLSTIAYGQLIAENAVLSEIPVPMITVIFHQLVQQLSAEAAELSLHEQVRLLRRGLIRWMIVQPRTPPTDMKSLADHITRRHRDLSSAA
ncbi:MAG: acyl-CoA dehydrogenase family protein [Tepidisphaeraceae bacterium]